MVIAVNLNADLLGRGGTIASHGFEDEDIDEPPRADRHWRERISIDRFVKRQVFGAVGRPGLATVMIEAYNVMQDRITRARLAGDPPDIMISPRLGSIGWFDFHQAEVAMKIGAEAAERALDTIHEAVEALR
jgi:NTE family protein